MYVVFSTSGDKHVAEVDRVVHREADDDDAGDGLADAEGPAEEEAEAEDAGDDAADARDGEERQNHVLRRDREHHEGDGEADGDADQQAVDEGDLALVPEPDVGELEDLGEARDALREAADVAQEIVRALEAVLLLVDGDLVVDLMNQSAG